MAQIRANLYIYLHNLPCKSYTGNANESGRAKGSDLLTIVCLTIFNDELSQQVQCLYGGYLNIAVPIVPELPFLCELFFLIAHGNPNGAHWFFGGAAIGAHDTGYGDGVVGIHFNQHG